MAQMKTILFYEAGRPNAEGKVGGSYYSLYQLVLALRSSFRCLILFKYDNVTIGWYENLENVEVLLGMREDTSNSKNIVRKISSGTLISKFWYKELSALKKFFTSRNKYGYYVHNLNVNIIINNNRVTESLDILRYQVCSGAKIIQYQRAYEPYYPLFLRWLNLQTITVSDDVRFSLPQMVQKRSKTVYNWLSKPVFERRKNPSIGKPLRLVWLGRGVDWKGLNILEEIVLKSEYLGVHLDIYMMSDSNPSYSQLLDKYHETKPANVRLLLNRSQRNIELQDYDCLLHTSTSPEPFGRVIIEAMSAGLIPITTGIGGSSEIVTHGINGFITKSKRPEDFIAMLIYVQSLSVNRLNKISDESYNNWNTNFSGASLKVLLDVIE